MFVSLSPHELRQFRSWIDQVDFRYDVLGNLPVEILEQILGYLPLYQCFRMRQVSKEWHRMLSATQTVEHLLRSWYPGDQANYEVPDGLTASDVLSSRAEHVDAYRTGRAFSVASRSWKVDYRDKTMTSVAYSHGVVAWTDGTKGTSYHIKWVPSIVSSTSGAV